MNNGDKPAFPISPFMSDTEREKLQKAGFHGLTKREFFAGQAMEGMWANGTIAKALSNSMEDEEVIKLITETAYNQADAMLKAGE